MDQKGWTAGSRAALALVAALTLAPAGCGTADAGEPRAAIESMQSALLQGIVSRDPAAIVALFADSAVVHAPDGMTMTGREAIAAHIAMLLPGVQGYSLSSRRVAASDDLAYEEVTFQVVAEIDGDPSREITGSALIVLGRGADGWRIVSAGIWVGSLAEMNHDMGDMDHDMGDMPGM